ncbi:hypothetical protein B0H16DRAFT_1840544 [Mycena metata]|uniref:Retrotransposon gag domain-containing protein n=1 Tax=Mycena metata TaxID=1033252 RepID=A0AAD7IVG2_9AGAR|nr:hypothetical protein B0H16DRAFT_1840544 [Mycena metata]
MDYDEPRFRAAGTDTGILHPSRPFKLIFGSVDDAPLDSPAAVNAAASSAPRATKPATASAVESATSVARPPSASGVVKPAAEKRSVRGDDTGRTAVTRKTSRSDGKHKPELESTVLKADEMSLDKLRDLARRHEAFAAQIRAQVQRKVATDSTQSESDDSNPEESVGTSEEDTGSEEELDEPYVHATMHECEGDSEFVAPIPTVEPGRSASHDEGRNFDAGNWGDVSLLENFSESRWNSQKTVEHKRVTTHCEVLVDNPLPHRPKPDAQKAKSPTVALGLDGQRSQSNNNASNLKVDAPKTELHEVQNESQPRSNASGRESKTNHAHMSGQTTNLLDDKRIQQLFQRTSELERQREEPNSPKVNGNKDSKSSMTPKLRGVTPGKLAAGRFLDNAIRGVYKTGHGSQPSDSSDSSSSSGNDPSSPSADESRGSRHHQSSPRMSAKRKRGAVRKHRMLLKPIPPTRYSGEANANVFQRFARESSTYVKMGRVPDDEQIYFVSYYLDGKALDFYNQVVILKKESWSLRTFFVELFEFCFPVDFRNEQRKRLKRCYQNDKSVAAHVAEWSEIFNTIGAPETQEKVVQLFNSFNFDVQTEIYRKGKDPEVSTWDEVVRSAGEAEILLKIAEKGRRMSEPEYQDQENEDEYCSDAPEEDDARYAENHEDSEEYDEGDFEDEEYLEEDAEDEGYPDEYAEYPDEDDEGDFEETKNDQQESSGGRNGGRTETKANSGGIRVAAADIEERNAEDTFEGPVPIAPLLRGGAARQYPHHRPVESALLSPNHPRQRPGVAAHLCPPHLCVPDVVKVRPFHLWCPKHPNMRDRQGVLLTHSPPRAYFSRLTIQSAPYAGPRWDSILDGKPPKRLTIYPRCDSGVRLADNKVVLGAHCVEIENTVQRFIMLSRQGGRPVGFWSTIRWGSAIPLLDLNGHDVGLAWDLHHHSLNSLLPAKAKPAAIIEG